MRLGLGRCICELGLRGDGPGGRLQASGSAGLRLMVFEGTSGPRGRGELGCWFALGQKVGEGRGKGDGLPSRFGPG